MARGAQLRLQLNCVRPPDYTLTCGGTTGLALTIYISRDNPGALQHFQCQANIFSFTCKRGQSTGGEAWVYKYVKSVLCSYA